jgi:hypothetical protein
MKRRKFMKLMSMGVAAIIAASTFGVAQAQQNHFGPDPKTCVSNVSALDTNGDSYVDNTEMAEYGRIENNVDTNGDGRISAQETTVACRDGALQALKPQG